MFASFKSGKAHQEERENPGLTLLDTPNLDLCLRTLACIKKSPICLLTFGDFYNYDNYNYFN